MNRSFDDITHSVATGARSAHGVCADTLAAIRAHNGTLNAFLAVDDERALTRAAALDARLDTVKHLPLLGVPVAIKDNICTRGLTTTAGSKMLANFTPPYDATVIERLEAAGAVVIGKTNCDEFAMGSSNENSAFGPVKNPWDTTRIPGGSSGGSAVAVAAGLVPVALGSDTGGSVRQPAAHCGVVGLKPTYGRVSRFGLIAFGSSLDQIGPLCRTVRDAARIGQVIAGHDPRDATSSTRAVGDWTSTLGRGCAGIRVGVPRTLLDGIDQDVREALETALATLTELGATVVDVALPHARFAIPVYYLVATAEASSNLARYDGVRFGVRAPGSEGGLSAMYRRTRHAGFGAEVKRRIMLGTYVLSAGYYDAYYLKAQQVRTLIRQDYERALAEVDVVAMPTSPTAPFALGARLDDPLQMYLADIFTVSANLSGLPGLSVPGGRSREGLPIGLQLMGRAHDESTLVQVAHAYEQAAPWAHQTPPIFAAATPRPDASA